MTGLTVKNTNIRSGNILQLPPLPRNTILHFLRIVKNQLQAPGALLNERYDNSKHSLSLEHHLWTLNHFLSTNTLCGDSLYCFGQALHSKYLGPCIIHGRLLARRSDLSYCKSCAKTSGRDSSWMPQSFVACFWLLPIKN